MKKNTLLIGVMLMMLTNLNVFAQTSVYWRTDGPSSGNWEWGSSDQSSGTDGQWFYSVWGGNRSRPDHFGSHNIFIDGNGLNTMNLNGTNDYGLKSIVFTSNATDARVLNTDASRSIWLHNNNGNPKIENQSIATHTFNVPINYNASVELNPVNGDLIFNTQISNNGHWTDIWGANSKTLTISGGLSGTGGLSLKQNSKVVFTVAATYSGNTFVDAGTLELQNNFSSATITIASGAKLIINGSNVTIQNLTVESGGTVEVLAGKQLTVAGTLTNNGTLTLKSDATGTATMLNSGTVSGSGTYNVDQYLAHARNWYVSSPLTAATIPTSGYTVNRRNEEAAAWVPVSSGTFTPGLGYIALPGAAPSTLNFSGGSINTGDVSVTLTKSGASSNGFNLIGNPYPAHLTWLKAFTDANTTLIEPTIWYRTNAGTANNSGQWSFQTYNAHSGLGVPSNITGKIPPMQAFWVRAKVAGALTLNSTLTRSHETGNLLKAPKVEQMPKVRLQMTNGVYTDELLLYFNEDASDGFDAYDSRKMFINNTISEFYTVVGNEKLVINGMQQLLDNTVVPLGLNIASTGNYVIRANEISNVPANMQVLLRDNVSSEIFDLQNTEGKALTLNQENEISRYSLVFKVVGGTTDAKHTTTNNWKIEKLGSNVFTVRITDSNNKLSRLIVYNALGQKLQEISFTSDIVNFALSAEGVYHIKLISNGIESVKSLIY